MKTKLRQPSVNSGQQWSGAQACPCDTYSEGVCLCSIVTIVGNEGSASSECNALSQFLYDNASVGTDFYMVPSFIVLVRESQGVT